MSTEETLEEYRARRGMPAGDGRPAVDCECCGGPPWEGEHLPDPDCPRCLGCGWRVDAP